MSDYEDKCKYYTDLYTPKSSSGSSSSVSKKSTVKPNYSPDPGTGSTPTSTPSNSSSGVDSAYVAMLEDRGQLQNLASNTRSSKSSYDSDVDTLSTNLGSVVNTSIVVNRAIEKLQAELSVDTYDVGYSNAITRVVNSTP